jgi:glycosyltransferase involved in cell wall biosynthesis
MNLDVDAQLISLNDVSTIRKSLQTLLSNDVNKIVVVDGGSIDGSMAVIADLPVEVMTSLPGIGRQTAIANAAMGQPYIFVSEADQVYDPGFINRLKNELNESGFDGIQARKYRDFGPTYWDKAQSIFLGINQPSPGACEFISGPQIWRSEIFKNLVAKLESKDSYSFDTSLSEVIRNSGVRVGIGITETKEIGECDFFSFQNRMRNYGEGDFLFFRENFRDWSTLRKIQSLTHVFRRYCLEYPLIAARMGHPILGVSFFFLTAIFRYYFWFSRALGNWFSPKH